MRVGGIGVGTNQCTYVLIAASVSIDYFKADVHVFRFMQVLSVLHWTWSLLYLQAADIY